MTVEFTTAAPEPPLDRQEDALQWAIKECRRLAPLMKSGAEDESIAWHQKVLRSGAVYGGEIGLGGAEFDRAADYVEIARKGSKLGTKVSLELAAALIERGETLRGPLQEFIVEFLRNPKEPRRGAGRRASSDLTSRNMWIRYLITTILFRSKFPATRNEATKARPSAASIVRDALKTGAGIHLTEAAINKIWNDGNYKVVAAFIASERKAAIK
jgi:hypothetical protein